MKKKLLVTALLTLFIVCLLVLGISAASYTINYDDKATETTDENGTITLKADPVNTIDTSPLTQNSVEVIIKDKDGEETKVIRQFLGWYTLDGRVFEPGETITVTEDTRLYRATGVSVYDYESLTKVLGFHWFYVRLEFDVETASQIGTNKTGTGSIAILDLNGHNITSTAAKCFGSGRSGLMLLGEGNITHTGTTSFFETAQHGYGDEGRHRLYVSKDLTITTNATLYRCTNNITKTDIPNIKIFGNVTCDAFVNLGSTVSATIEIFEDSSLTVNSTSFIVNRSENAKLQMYVSIYGGSITVPEDVVWCDTYSKYEFNITGGSFSTAPSDIMLTNGYDAVLNEETGVYEVAITTCPNTNGEHIYTEAEIHGENINCLEGRMHYFRCECGDYYITSVNNFGHSYTIVTIDKEATLTETGIKRVTCDRCADSYTYDYSISPLTIEVEIVVATENGTKTITVIAGDLYQMTTTETTDGFTCEITGINSIITDGEGNTYDKSSMVKLVIPSGTTSINSGAITDFANLKEVELMDRANLTFSKNAIKNCPLLEKVVVGDCDVTFVAGSGENSEAGIFYNCPLLTTLDISKASATFNKYSFASNKTIKYLKMGEGNTYLFMEDSFRHSSLVEVVIPDNTTTTLHKKCFAETVTIEYVYIGANAIASKSIGDDNNQTSIFGGNSYLAKVVLMDINYIGKWSLSTKKPGNAYQPLCDMVVYSHSESLSFHAEAFNDRAGSYTVYIYSANPNITSVTSSSNYVIYKGLGHAYKQDVITPSTCVTPGIAGYVADGCPCGIDYRSNTYTSVANKQTELNGVTYEPFGTETVELPLSNEHTDSDIIKNVEFKNGLTSLGTKTFKCLYCDVATSTEEEPTFEAIFECLGFSTKIDDPTSMVQGFLINNEALYEYEAITNIIVDFGVLGAIKSVVNTEELIGADGKPTVQKVASTSCI